MSTARHLRAPTPRGGVASDIVYTDADGNVADEQKAAGGIITEYDAQGSVISTT